MMYKKQLRIFVLFLAALVGFCRIGFAQVAEWKSFTSVGTVRDIANGGDFVWAGSDGGAIRLAKGDQSLVQFTNTDGLSQNDVVALVVDNLGTIWFALQNGTLNRFFPANETWQVIEDYKDQQITDIVAFGDSLYIGLALGVSLFTIDKLEVKETYQNLGLSTGDDVEKIAANAIVIDGNDIWVSTNKGIAQSSLLLPNLQAPSSWVQHTTQDGLPVNVVNEVAILDGIPYAATSRGLYALNDQIWTDTGLSSGNIVSLGVAGQNAFFQRNALIALTSDGVYYLAETGTWSRLGSGFSDITALETASDGSVFIGRRNLGLAEYDFTNSAWHLSSANAPASNDFKSLVIDSKDRLWCASRAAGVHLFDGQNWTNFTRGSGLPSNDYRTILEDHQGRIWAGSWGGGITIFDEQEGGFEISVLDTTEGILAGFLGDRGFVLVPGLVQDQFNNIWILNREAFNTQVAAVRTPNDEFAYFTTTQGVNSRFLSSLEVDNTGRLWLGSEDRGVQVIDYNETLFDNRDDTFNQGLTQSEDGLYSNRITALIEDRDGTMWIGTDEGLNLWSQGVIADEFDTPVNTVGIDAINNKWVGTENGISILRGHFDRIGDITVGNSGLVSGNVQSFAFNVNTGVVWIGTDNGLSRAQTLFTAPKDDLSQLTGFPNPFIINDAGSIFTITNLAEDTSVSIYNSAGKLMKSFTAFNDIQGAQAMWDGTDRDGNLVASGIYVYLAYTSSNISARGKVAVIRR